MLDVKSKPWGWLVLFITTGTLLCCALPIILVSLGMGAVVASLVSTLPILVTLSLYKNWMFAISGLFIFAGFLWHKFGNQTCPADPQLAEHCERARVWNKRLLFTAGIVWMIGFIAAYLAVPLFQ